MPSEILKAVLKGRLAGTVETRNIFYGQVVTVLPDTRGAVAELYIADVLSPVRTYISSLWTTESIDVYNWVAGEWAFVENIAYVSTGSSGGEILPYQVAAVLLGKTLAKRKMGRKFLAGFTEAASVGASITGAVLVALASAALAYVSTYTSAAGSTWEPGIVTRGGTYYAFNSGLASALWGSMRRRKPNIGI